jgi:arylsulfatase A-like enzyme
MANPILFTRLMVRLLAGSALFASAVSAQTLDRSILPIALPSPPTSTILDVRDAKAPPRVDVAAPKGAPNVLIILIDDMGFGASSAFGGAIPMPVADQMAKQGIKFSQFHTTALCSPTRAALLTGRNHHRNNMSGITEVATAMPGNTGIRPASVATVAETMRLNGYSTAHFGKNHETPAWEVSVSGPTTTWPTRQGFDKFYGFMGGESNQWAPLLYDGTSQVEIPHDPDYHLMNDLANQSVNWVRAQKSLTPDRPFFIYFAPGATHAPHHAPKDWIAKQRGKYDGGWDKMREETLARQIALGVVPKGTKLAPKPKEIKDWAALSADEKRLFARQMEVYAAFAAYTDFETGRLIEAIRATGQLDNTLIFYILGDNGASAEGGFNGIRNENTYFNRVDEPIEAQLKVIDTLGGPENFNHYSAGWAVATNTPFTWTKQVAGNYGGTRNGMIVQWPKAIAAKGEVRSQWHHVIDVAPTILEAAGIPQPTSVNGTVQEPIQGVSMLYTADARAPDRRTTQYFEIAGNRGIYHNGWFAGAIHRAPWESTPRAKLSDDIWELYDTRNDFALANDLAARNPAKLAELKAVFLKEAEVNRVLPMDDRSTERFNAAIAGRPDLMGGRTSLTVFPGMVGMNENAFINTKGRSHTITAEIDVPANGAEGVIIVQAGRFGGWALYVKDGKPTFHYNHVGLKRVTIASNETLKPGKAVVRYEFAMDGEAAPGKAGTGSLFIDDRKVGEGRIEATTCCTFSADEGTDVGRDDGTPVSEAYASPNRFAGKIAQVRVDLK